MYYTRPLLLEASWRKRDKNVDISEISQIFEKLFRSFISNSVAFKQKLLGWVHLWIISHFRRVELTSHKLVQCKFTSNKNHLEWSLMISIITSWCPPYLTLLMGSNESKNWKSRNLEHKIHWWKDPNEIPSHKHFLTLLKCPPLLQCRKIQYFCPLCQSGEIWPLQVMRATVMSLPIWLPFIFHLIVGSMGTQGMRTFFFLATFQDCRDSISASSKLIVSVKRYKKFSFIWAPRHHYNFT